MNVKIFIAIIFILVIAISIFVVLNLSNEEIKNNYSNNSQKFIGNWKVIYSEEIPNEDETPDTTEEPDSNLNYEIYEFNSNGTFFHIEADNNYSGIWKINNSNLELVLDNPFGNLDFFYKYVFSDDNTRAFLSIFEDPQSIIEIEKINDF